MHFEDTAKMYLQETNKTVTRVFGNKENYV